MSKPEWKDAPIIANWRAQDESGEWFWYQLRPKKNGNAWDEDSYQGSIWFAGKTERQKDWSKTLERRP